MRRLRPLREPMRDPYQEEQVTPPLDSKVDANQSKSSMKARVTLSNRSNSANLRESSAGGLVDFLMIPRLFNRSFPGSKAPRHLRLLSVALDFTVSTW